MRALLDINVLIALLDPDHSLHQRARDWFEPKRRDRLDVLPGHPERMCAHHGGAGLPAPTTGSCRHGATPRGDAEPLP